MNSLPRFKGNEHSHDKMVIEHFLAQAGLAVDAQGLNRENGEAVMYLHSLFDAKARSEISKKKHMFGLISYDYWERLLRKEYMPSEDNKRNF
jgi:hypothetical protein